MAYGPSWTESYERGAALLAKVLRGANPGDIPFEQPTHVELSLNKKAARAIGIEFPRALLLQADLIVE